MIFGYEAFTRDGEKVFGTVNADRKEDAAFSLYQKGLIVSQISSSKNEKRTKIKEVELIMFTRLLANAVDAHIPLVRGLEITMDELHPKSVLKNIILSILYEIKVGKAISEAFQLYPHVFSRFYISMLKSGEKTGKLAQSLNQILAYLIKRYEMKKKISSAIMYPSFIMAFAGLIMVFFVTVLIPRFQESYSGFGIEMPGMTMALINMTAWIKSYWYFIAIIVGGVIFLGRRWLETEKGKLLSEKLLFTIPVIGDLYLKDIVSRLTRTLSVLMGNGVTLPDSIELVKGILGNRTYEITLDEASKMLSQGKSFASALKDKQEVPPILVQMIAMGEESGRLSELLGHLSEFYEKDVDTSVEKITSVITPVMIIFIGIIIAFVVIALYMPIFNVSKIMQ